MLLSNIILESKQVWHLDNGIYSLLYTVVSQKRADDGLSAHPPVLPRFPAEV